MSIEDRNLTAGTRLVATYKKQRYVCVVEASEDGTGVVYALEGGSKHKTPSGAGKEVLGGGAVNGWRFWTVEGEEPAAEAPKAKRTKKAQPEATEPEPEAALV